MKANKALKRLARIEALVSDVTERYLASAPHIQEALHDAKAAVTRAKEAVSLHASSRTAKTPPVKHSKRRISEEGMKRIIAATKKRWALKRAEAAKAAPGKAKRNSH
jgi:hypothetical protein